MSDDRTGRELTPRPEEEAGAVTPRETALTQPGAAAADRFYAGDTAHTVGLSEERAAQVVRQSSNARMVAFLGTLFLVLFVPIYWIYDIGVPALGIGGRLVAEVQRQYVTDVARGHELFLANCARCHGTSGQGGVGPPLNDQGKLYQALTPQGLPGPGHLSPDYIRRVLEVGGRYVCGDPKSAMQAWLQPAGPLNYREVEEIIAFILASDELTWTHAPDHAEAGETLPPPEQVSGWRDPDYSPPPDATPVPACWRAPAGTPAAGTPAPVESPGTAENPRIIEVQGTEQVQWVDPATDQRLTSISVVEGETVEFHIINESANVPHNFHIGSADELTSAPEQVDLPGVDTLTVDTSPQTFTYTFDSLPDQPQFACTVLGHAQSMRGDFVLVQPGDAPASGQPGGGPTDALTTPAPSDAQTTLAPSDAPPAGSPAASPAGATN